MGKRNLLVGIESYKMIIDEDYYYVDKTLMIKELIDRQSYVSLFARPRRFGKTLAVDMDTAIWIIKKQIVNECMMCQ